MSRIIIKNAKVVTPFREIPNGGVVIEDGVIEEVFEGEKKDIAGGREIIDAKGYYLLPGFIDIHVHGGGGVDTLCPGYEDMNKISRMNAASGVTSFLATPATAGRTALLETAKLLRNYIERGMEYSRMIGIHFEGPFFNSRNIGAQNTDHIRKPDREEADELLTQVDGYPCMMSLAPELEGALDMISHLSARGVVVAIGHTDATYEQTVEAIERGVRNATHTFNGMRGLHHREPGTVGAILTDGRVYAELICDGIHVHPAVARLILRCKGPEKVILMTDAVMAAGMPDGEYELSGRRIYLKGGEVRIASGSLAGSVLRMNMAVRNMVKLVGADIKDAARMASYNPASLLGIEGRTGSIEPGKEADLTILDGDFHVVRTLVKGRTVYTRSE